MPEVPVTALFGAQNSVAHAAAQFTAADDENLDAQPSVGVDELAVATPGATQHRFTRPTGGSS